MSLFHLIVVGLYPFIAVLEFNWNDVSVPEFLRSLPIAFAVLVAMLLLWRVATTSWTRAGVGTSGTYLLVLGYGPVARWWRADLRVPGAGLVDLRFLPAEILPLALLCAGIVALIFLLRRVKDDVVNFMVLLLNYFAAALLLMSAGSVAIKAYLDSSMKLPPLPIAAEARTNDMKARPNVYYIILDGYAGDTVLRELYGIQSSLSEELERQGFYIAGNAHSNYFRTNYSLASSLNMSYLDPAVLPKANPRMGFAYLKERLQHSAVRRIFESEGYRTTAFQTGYRTTEWKDAAEYVELLPWNAVTATAASYLQLPLVRTEIARSLHAYHRERIEKVFPALLRESSSPGPRFVFMHVIAPHPPFVYEQDGSLYFANKVYTLGDGDDYGGASDYVERYKAQVTYISRKTAEAVEALRANDPAAYIIVQGDHGPGSKFNRESAAETNIEERFSILSAYYFPDRRYEMLYPSITPVNSFRVVMNKLEMAPLPLLPDRSFFAEARAPATFIDVSDRLQRE